MMRFGKGLQRSCMVSAAALACVLALSCGAAERTPGSSPPPGADAGKGVSLRVLWTISSYRIGSRAAWGEKEARAMLFKPLDISATAITFDGQTCHDVAFTDEVVDAAPYLRQRFQVAPQELGLEEDTAIKVVKTTCWIPGFAEYVRLPDRRLLVPIQGVLFVLDPAVNY